MPASTTAVTNPASEVKDREVETAEVATIPEQAPHPVRGRAWTGVGCAVAAALLLAPFVFLGVVNGDEGWYTVSSQLAARGQLPYRDFAFTQGPVYLYLLAPFERLIPGLITARTISAICAAIGIGLILVVADRIAGRRALLFSAALLLAATPSLPYWLALTKTYGVASLFLAATIYALTSPAPPARRLPTAVVFAFGFALTRPSAALFALIVFIAALRYAPDVRSRITITGVAIAAATPFLALVALAPSAALWGLVEYHDLSPRPPVSLGTKIFGRSFDVMRAWPGPTLLVMLAVIALATSSSTRRRLRSHPEMIAVVGGLATFLLLHELGVWFWAEEYVVPALPSIIVLAVSTLVVFGDESHPAPGRRNRPPRRDRFNSRIEQSHITLALVTCVAITVVTGGHTGYLGTPGWNGSPSADRALARCVRQNSTPDDRVLALFFSDLVTEAHRSPVARTSLGLFSYQDVSPHRARELHILERTEMLDLLADQRPKVVVLSTLDKQILTLAGYFSTHDIDSRPYAAALDENYRVACQATLNRQTPNTPLVVEVFVRKR